MGLLGNVMWKKVKEGFLFHKKYKFVKTWLNFQVFNKFWIFCKSMLFDFISQDKLVAKELEIIAD